MKEMTREKIYNFFILLKLYVLQLTVTNIIFINLAIEYSHFVAFIHIYHCFIHYLLMRNDLYSYKYYNLPKIHKKKLIVIKSLDYSTLTILIVTFSIPLFDSVFSWEQSARSYLAGTLFLVFLGIGFFLLIHVSQVAWIYRLTKLRYLRKKILIVGEPDKYFPIFSFFQGAVNSKIFAGNLFIEKSQWYFRGTDNKEKIISNQEIPDLLFRLIVGEIIIFIAKGLPEKNIYQFIMHCQENGIGYYLISDIQKPSKGHFWTSYSSYVPVVIERYATRRDSLALILCKRIIDLILVSLSTLIFLPVGLIIAIAIMVKDGRPVFYVCKRVGKNGKIIKFYKFRSMVRNAEKLQKDLLKYNLRLDGSLFKMKNDPRVAKLGKILREYSLDELPQLLNVLKGDISLVGPRPHLINEVETYSSSDMLRLECIPGIACLPQIYERNRVGYRKWMDLDLLYRKKWSLLLDLKILIRAVQIVIAPLFGYAQRMEISGSIIHKIKKLQTKQTN